MDKLLAEQGNSRAHSYCKYWNIEILGPNHTGTESRIGIISLQMLQVTITWPHSFKMHEEYTGYGFRATWSNMYTLSKEWPVKHDLIFWYLVKSDLSSVRFCSCVHWISHFYQSTWNTRSCLTGHHEII